MENTKSWREIRAEGRTIILRKQWNFTERIQKNWKESLDEDSAVIYLWHQICGWK